jgi:hypothetical protein
MFFDVSAELYTKEGKGFTAVKADSFLLLTNVLDVLIYALFRSRTVCRSP